MDISKRKPIHSWEDYDWHSHNFCWAFHCKHDASVIFTVPHDGCFFKNIEGIFQKRMNATIGRDKKTWPIVKDILLQSHAHAVRGIIPRHFLDYNRPNHKDLCSVVPHNEEQVAYDDEQLKIFYDAYHNNIDYLIRRAIENHGKENVLLIDLHGFINQPDYGEFDLILGTGNRNTISSNVDIHLYEHLVKRGYRVFLPAEESVRCGEPDKYQGHFTVHYYADKYGIDTVQLETHKSFRLNKNKKLGKKLSNDIAEFITIFSMDA